MVKDDAVVLGTGTGIRDGDGKLWNVYGAKLGDVGGADGDLGPTPWTVIGKSNTFDVSNLHTTAFWDYVPETSTSPCCEVICTAIAWTSTASYDTCIYDKLYWYNDITSSWDLIWDPFEYYCYGDESAEYHQNNILHVKSGYDTAYMWFVGMWNYIWKHEIWRNGRYRHILYDYYGHVGVDCAPEDAPYVGALYDDFTITNAPFMQTDMFYNDQKVVSGTRFLVGDTIDVKSIPIDAENHYAEGPIANIEYKELIYESFGHVTTPALPHVQKIEDYGSAGAKFKIISFVDHTSLGATYESSANSYYKNCSIHSSEIDPQYLVWADEICFVDYQLVVDEHGRNFKAHFVTNPPAVKFNYVHIDWGDGGIGTTLSQIFLNNKDVTHTYDNIGDYTITVQYQLYSDSNIITEQYSVTIEEYAIIAGDFAYKTLRNTPSHYIDQCEGAEWTSWKFVNDYNNITFTNRSPFNTSFTLDALYNYITLSATNDVGTISETYTILAYPITATVSHTTGHFPLTVQFTDTCEAQHYGRIWDFGDGATSTEENPTHTYYASGTYPIKLTIISTEGYFDSKQETVATIIVTDPTPTTADFSISPTVAERTSYVTLYDESKSDYDVDRWEMTWGDGWKWTYQNYTSNALKTVYYNGDEVSSEYVSKFELGQSISYQYNSTGTFDVTLKIRGTDRSDTKTIADAVTITDIYPRVDFSASSTSVFPGDIITFTNESTRTTDVKSWEWDFGDGHTSSAYSPTHAYADEGTYSVTLVATTNSDTHFREYKSDYITIQPMPSVQRTMYLSPIMDTMIHEGNPDESYAGRLIAYPVGIDGATDRMQYLVKFNLSDIPADATIDSATLKLHRTAVGPEDLTVYAYTLANQWDQYTTWNTKPSSGTFIKQIDLQTTTSEGAIEIDVASVVKSATNGFILLVDPSTVSKYTYIHSSNAQDSAKYPMLIITYHTQEYGTNFYANKTSGFTPLEVQFFDTSYLPGAISYSWDFGDGSGSSSQFPTHTYSLPAGTDFDTYTVSLYASGVGHSDTKVKSDYITIWRDTTPPIPEHDKIIADFSAIMTTGDAPFVVTFSNDSVGNVTDWLWDFGDGSFSTSSSPSHTYSSPGRYTVVLYARNSSTFDIEAKAGYIVVTKPVSPPNASFEFGHISGVLPRYVEFINTSTGDITSTTWDFGDSTTSNSFSPTHKYTQAGTYTVTLDLNNGASTFSKDITIPSSDTVAEFTIERATGREPFTVQFTDKSIGATSWLWTFGDGATSTEQNPRHTFSYGIHDVKLSINNNESINIKPGIIIVYPETPIPRFSISQSANTVTFNNQSVDAESYTWYFGDGSWSSITNPTHIYNCPGRYIAKLVARRQNTHATAYKLIEVI